MKELTWLRITQILESNRSSIPKEQYNELVENLRRDHETKTLKPFLPKKDYRDLVSALQEDREDECADYNYRMMIMGKNANRRK